MSAPSSDLRRERDDRARAAAQASVAGLDIRPAAKVLLHSRGRVAVIGGDDAQYFAPRLIPELHPQVILTEGTEEPGVPVLSVGSRTLAISGHMGAFEICLGEQGDPGFERLEVDLILDLSTPPCLDVVLKPPGYLCCQPEPAALDAMELTLKEMRGTFEKPQFFSYDPALCAHSRSGQLGCSRCIDICPAQAIRPLAEGIEVDPYRCQGGGACTSVCPSGALQYAYPAPGDLQERVRTLLKVYRGQGGADPRLVFVASEGEALPENMPSNLLWIPVEEVAGVGLEVWLGALAYGARGVFLVEDGLTEDVSQALQRQLSVAAEILAALGYPRDAVRLMPADALSAPPQGELMPALEPASFAPVGGKRQNAFVAIDHLYRQAPRPISLVSLPQGAPFGTAQVDDKACTLCMACVGNCPGQALQAGGESPRLQFVEANCVQCGICTHTCPEDAIWISPRLLFDEAARRAPRTLYEEPPFACVSCGKPFATRRVVDTLLSRLAGHPMFQGERARRRLMMCEDCRVIDIVQDPETMDTDVRAGAAGVVPEPGHGPQ